VMELLALLLEPAESLPLFPAPLQVGLAALVSASF
jgi:hypothetical protein